MNIWVRKIHRWLGVALTLSIVASFVALAQPNPAVWVSFIPLIPLALLLVTGWYMLIRPYGARWRARRRAAERAASAGGFSASSNPTEAPVKAG